MPLMMCMTVLKIEKCALIRFVAMVVDHFRDTCDTTSIGYTDRLSRRRMNIKSSIHLEYNCIIAKINLQPSGGCSIKKVILP